MALNIHGPVKDKLKHFYDAKKIPNIIFHGSSGCGKRTLVNEFIDLIYEGDKRKINDFVMYVNCAHGKGIKFIREELKFFAKTNIISNGGDAFKSIVLLNADKLTIDAQSALRRCIELFSHNTRFFIIVEDKYKLLKPILSRFCEFFIPEPTFNNKPINLHKYNIDRVFNTKLHTNKLIEWLKNELLLVESMVNNESTEDLDVASQNTSPSKHDVLVSASLKLYEKGYSAIDILNLLEKSSFLPHFSTEKKYELLFAFGQIKKEFRNEKLLIMFILNWLFISSDVCLENISFM
jgi:hypothetical protein